MPTSEILKKTSESLKQVQSYDTSTFDNDEELGRALSLKDAIDPAEKLIGLFNKIPVSTLGEFADQQLNTIAQSANQVHKLFSEAEEFNAQVENPSARRDQIIQSIRSQYDNLFGTLHPLISFSAASATDFQLLEREGRATIKAIEDNTMSLFQKLEKMEKEAEEILAEVRKTAEQQGVSQQAIYFSKEADSHTKQADNWQFQMYVWFGLLLLYSMGALFIHKVPFFSSQFYL